MASKCRTTGKRNIARHLDPMWSPNSEQSPAAAFDLKSLRRVNKNSLEEKTASMKWKLHSSYLMSCSCWEDSLIWAQGQLHAPCGTGATVLETSIFCFHWNVAEGYNLACPAFFFFKAPKRNRNFSCSPGWLHHRGFNSEAYLEAHLGPVLAKPNCDKNRECGQSLPIILDGKKEGDSWTLRLSFVSPLVFGRLVRKSPL